MITQEAKTIDASYLKSIRDNSGLRTEDIAEQMNTRKPEDARKMDATVLSRLLNGTQLNPMDREEQARFLISIGVLLRDRDSNVTKDS